MIPFLRDKECVTIDVRPYLEKGEDPFKVLQESLKKLAKNEVLEVLINFEPIPLIGIQEKQGYQTITAIKEGVYHTYFRPTEKVRKKGSTQNAKVTDIVEVLEERYDALISDFKGELITLDVRDLEMPQPLVLILETTTQLKVNQAIKIFHKRIPKHLLPELEEKGLKTFICPISEGNVMLFIGYQNELSGIH